MKKGEMTPDQLQQVFAYDPETGLFERLIRNGRRGPPGPVPVRLDGSGYPLLSCFGVTYQAHRVAMAFVQGQWPDAFVDHIDGNRANNRLSNLRLATPGQNSANRGATKRSKTGFKGVFFQGGSIIARIKFAGEDRYLGTFASCEDAAKRYDEVARLLLGPFAFQNMGVAP